MHPVASVLVLRTQPGDNPAGGATAESAPGLPKSDAHPLFGSFLGAATMRGAEGPVFFSRKTLEKWAVTLRIDGAGRGNPESPTP